MNDRARRDTPQPVSTVWVVLAGLADAVGRSETPQDLPGLGDTLATDCAGALVEHPVGSGLPPREKPQLHRSASVRCVLLHGFILLLG
jgi:hypothetical protein